MLDTIRLLPSTLLRQTRTYTRKLWVRVFGMGLLAVFAVGLAQLIEPLVPPSLASTLPGEAADRLLQIIANAMLAATIFAMTVMVSVYRNSSSQWTPRVHRLIMQDRTTQKTMAAFIGAYVYALVAIVLRELGVFGDERGLVLFAVTVLVLVLVVFSLIRWVLHLQTFGSLLDVTRDLENLTRRRFAERLETPCLGCHPLSGPVPEAAWPIRAPQSGYIQAFYPEGLQAAAAQHEVEIYLSVPIGSFVFLNAPLAWIHGEPELQDAEERASFTRLICDHVAQSELRSYDQDPTFGLVVLGEIASKALSPGINDPGTAIDVISRIGRILSGYSSETDQEESPKLDRLWVPPLSPDHLLDAGFGALSRDGAAIFEVQHRLQDTLSGLMHHPDPGLSRAARRAGALALRRALEAMRFEPDRARLLSVTAAPIRQAAAAQEDAVASTRAPVTR